MSSAPTKRHGRQAPGAARVRRRWPVSIRLRLTLLYGAILALALALFGGAIYAIVERALLETARKALVTEAVGLDAGRVRAQLTMPASAGGGGLEGWPALGLDVQIRSITGTVQVASLDLHGARLPLAPSELASVRRGATIGPAPVTLGGQPALLYSYRADTRGGPDAGGRGSADLGQHGPGPPSQGPSSQLIVQLALSLAPQERVLGLLCLALAGGVVVILLAVGAGWVLAGTALRPIARLTREARAIGEARDVGRRVAHPGRDDEVGRLAATFNAMLAGLDEASQAQQGAYRALRASYEAQRRFVADASHELRTPLTTIRANLDLLRREPPIAEGDRRDVLADLASEAERLSRLVGDLLTLARSDAGRPLRREPIPLRPLLERLVRRFAATQPGRSIDLEVASDAVALGDPDALTQVLLILLDNAAKFTPAEGTVRVAVAVREESVALIVRDTGVGIAPDALPHLFERFYQGDATHGGSGSGLGLAIAQALVSGQGGMIAVESQPRQGAAFTVTVPRAPAATRVAAATAPNPA